MAAEDFKTLREVGIAIEGIKHRLNLMTGVFALSVFIGAGALGYVANRVNMVAESIGEIKGRLDGIDKRLDTLTTLVAISSHRSGRGGWRRLSQSLLTILLRSLHLPHGRRAPTST
jgi:hypothetical protein